MMVSVIIKNMLKSLPFMATREIKLLSESPDISVLKEILGCSRCPAKHAQVDLRGTDRQSGARILVCEGGPKSESPCDKNLEIIVNRRS